MLQNPRGSSRRCSIPLVATALCLSIALTGFAVSTVFAQSTTAEARTVEVEALQRKIWSAFRDVGDAQAKLPPNQRAVGGKLDALELAARAPAISGLQALSAADGADPAGLQALGLVFQWGDEESADKAFDLLLSTHQNDSDLAPILESAYPESAAPNKRMRLQRLAQTTSSRSVAGASLYLLALETFRDPVAWRDPSRRLMALQQLRRVKIKYADVPTTILGAGAKPTIGSAAANLLFRLEHLMVGQRLPLMKAVDLEGRPTSSATFSGKLTLVDFWASWCPPCVAAFPGMRVLNDTYQGRGFQVVSISADSKPEIAKAFIERAGADWPQWFSGASGRVSSKWANGEYPFYLMVDGRGRILATGQHFEDIRPKVAAVISNQSRRSQSVKDSN